MGLRLDVIIFKGAGKAAVAKIFLEFSPVVLPLDSQELLHGKEFAERQGEHLEFDVAPGELGHELSGEEIGV